MPVSVKQIKLTVDSGRYLLQPVIKLQVIPFCLARYRVELGRKSRITLPNMLLGKMIIKYDLNVFGVERNPLGLEAKHELKIDKFC